jgi:hypothetical protein
MMRSLYEQQAPPEVDLPRPEQGGPPVFPDGYWEAIERAQQCLWQPGLSPALPSSWPPSVGDWLYYYRFGTRHVHGAADLSHVSEPWACARVQPQTRQVELEVLCDRPSPRHRNQGVRPLCDFEIKVLETYQQVADELVRLVTTAAPGTEASPALYEYYRQWSGDLGAFVEFVRHRHIAFFGALARFEQAKRRR